METFQGANIEKMEPSPHDIAFKVTQQNPDSISYASQFHYENTIAQACERSNEVSQISHGLLASMSGVSAFTSSAAAATGSTTTLGV